MQVTTQDIEAISNNVRWLEYVLPLDISAETDYVKGKFEDGFYNVAGTFVIFAVSSPEVAATFPTPTTQYNLEDGKSRKSPDAGVYKQTRGV